MCICLPILIFRSCNLVRVEVCGMGKDLALCWSVEYPTLQLFVCFLTNLAKFQKKKFVVFSPLSFRLLRIPSECIQ